MSSQPLASATPRPPQKAVLTIVASSLGTVFEWYDFFVFGTVATIISATFFTEAGATMGFIFTLATFAVGFAIRPLGAIIFGSLGDRIGRKRTFLATMVIMGLATVAVGLIPGYGQLGIAAPLLLVAARMLQGLAMGGEYGGAAVYVAEHAPRHSRGLHTSFIQVTATAGLVLALAVVLLTRTLLGEASFQAWGWRLPFLGSIILLIISVWIRVRLQESPAFETMVADGTRAKAPLRAALRLPGNSRRMATALFGALAGMTVVWYTGQFYTLFFLERVLKVDGATTNWLVGVALIAASPGFVLFGWLSDRIGRKPIILAGCMLATLSYMPLFKAMTAAGNPALAAAMASTPVTVHANPQDCATQFDPVGTARFVSSCDIAKAALSKAGVPHRTDQAGAGAARIEIGSVSIASFDGRGLAPAELTKQRAAFDSRLTAALERAGYPRRADPSAIDKPLVVGILFLMILYATMCYGPIAAALCEMFPPQVRYTSVSIPYNIATGWIGGFLPAAAFAISTATGNIFSGLWYPIAFASFTILIGLFFWHEERDRC